MGFQTSVAWSTAQSSCEDVGGYLAVLNSATENAEVTTYVVQYMTGGNKVWFGLSRVTNPSVLDWTWENGEVLTWTNWNSGEPGSSEYFCGLDPTAINANGARWFDANNSDTLRYYVCERDF
jgi:hypothetical protein